MPVRKSHILNVEVPKPHKPKTYERDTTYYYYKRWVWLAFPVACMDYKKSKNFSETMKRCNNTAGKGIS